MKKTLALGISVLLSYSMLQASEKINLVVPYKPGGNGLKVAKALEEPLKAKGWDVNFLSLGDCTNAKGFISSTSEKTMFIWDTGFFPNNSKAEDICHVETPTNKTLIAGVYERPDYICSVGKDVDIMTKDLGEITIGTGANKLPESQKKLITDGIPSKVRFVQYENSGAITTAIAAKEIDFSYDHMGKKAEKNGQAKCHYNTSNEVIGETKPFNSVIPNFGTRKTVVYLDSVNIDVKTKEKLSKDVFEIIQTSPELTELFNNTGVFKFKENSDVVKEIKNEFDISSKL